MTDYTKLVEALRWCSVDEYVPCKGCPMDEETHGTGCFNIMHQRAAAAIEELQQIADHYEQTAKDYWKEACEYKNKWVKSETDATNLTGKLAQAEADVERLNREIDKRIATEIELSNQVDALQAEVQILKVSGREAYFEGLAADAEPKRGEWVHRADFDYMDMNEVEHNHFMCNKCGFIHDFLDGHTSQYNYCPKCGAKMEVQDESVF